MLRSGVVQRLLFAGPLAVIAIALPFPAHAAHAAPVRPVSARPNAGAPMPRVISMGWPPDEKNLLPVGIEAPDFQLPRKGGGQLSLDDALKGKKAVLLSFWFAGCPACRTELPHLQKLYEQLKDRGMGMVAINSREPEEIVKMYLQRNQWTFDIVMAGDQGHTGQTCNDFGVLVYPTNFIIGKDRKILWRAAGYDPVYGPKIMRAVLKKAGITPAAQKASAKR